MATGNGGASREGVFSDRVDLIIIVIIVIVVVVVTIIIINCMPGTALSALHGGSHLTLTPIWQGAGGAISVPSLQMRKLRRRAE